MESMRLLKEWLDDGAMGNVTEVHAWRTGRWAATVARLAVQARPTDTPPVPETLDWDRWLGPVAFRPYHPAYHPLKWRAWLDFGTGPLGDMGCHILDPAFWALELGPPQSVEATSTHYDPAVASETYPRASIVRYTFPARAPAAREAHVVQRTAPAAGAPGAGARPSAARERRAP